MKLKQWLREYKQMTYAEYKAMPETCRNEFLYEHQKFCAARQHEEFLKKQHDRYNWRPMTEEELREVEISLAKEKARYELNLKIGGIDERGNYTALHYR